ncbi:MAG: hypothetical protein MUC95_04470 [Spirochaetes bacterium]|nr:hypothetical protein [Spirochaetota bacterium]
MLKRTPVVALLIAAIITVVIVKLIESPERPFTAGETAWLYFFSFLTSMGIAMLFDPYAKKAKAEFLKINFYEEKK